MKRFGVGIDNYGLFPLKQTPMEIMKWSKNNGSEGVQYSGISIEDHEGSFTIPVFDEMFLSRFPDLNPIEFLRLIQMAHQAAQMYERGELSITGRKEWPGICEERMKNNIKALKSLLK